MLQRFPEEESLGLRRWTLKLVHYDGNILRKEKIRIVNELKENTKLLYREYIE